MECSYCCSCAYFGSFINCIRQATLTCYDVLHNYVFTLLFVAYLCRIFNQYICMKPSCNCKISAIFVVQVHCYRFGNSCTLSDSDFFNIAA